MWSPRGRAYGVIMNVFFRRVMNCRSNLRGLKCPIFTPIQTRSRMSDNASIRSRPVSFNQQCDDDVMLAKWMLLYAACVYEMF